MLDANLKAQTKAYLERLTRPVVITAYTDESAKGLETTQLLADIAALSDKVSVVTGDIAGQRIPSFSLSSPGHDIHLTFAGLPMGHEFTSLILALLQVGGHPPRAEDKVIEAVKALEGEFHFETYFSLTCQNCPDVVQALNLMAVLNPAIRHTAIDGALFQSEVDARQVMSVPSIFLNGELFAAGRMGVEEILAKIAPDVSGRAAREISAKDPFDVIVVGGGPASSAAAVYAARKGIRTAIIAERLGGQVNDTMAIENFISVPHTEGPKLSAALEAHIRDYDIDVMTMQRASQLERVDDGYRLMLESGASVEGKSVVLATGARWRKMGVPGEEHYLNKGVAFCPHCDGPLYKGKRVAVIGGGNSGVEAAIDLAGLVTHVTLIEFDSQLRADAVLQRKLASLGNVTVITSARSAEVLGNGNAVTGLRYEDRTRGDLVDIELEGIFVQIGLVPNTEWLKGTLDISPRGEILVDPRGATSLPGVFAAGDCTTTPYKQIVIAAGEGARAALSAFDYLIRTSAPAAEEAA